MSVKNFSATEFLRNGSRAEIRALRPEDRDSLLAAVGRTGERSLYRRFFASKRGFTEQEVNFYVNVDFVSHVALVAELEEDGQKYIVGGARYILVQPGRAEVAFAVVDEHQGRGIGSALMHHLQVIATEAGLTELFAEVLPENAAMMRVFDRSGLDVTTTRGADSIHVVLRLP